VASNQTFDKLTRLSNIAFTPHTTSAATVTLNVDGLGAKPLRSAPYVELPAGTLVQGTPYVCVFERFSFLPAGFFQHPLYDSDRRLPRLRRLNRSEQLV